MHTHINTHINTTARIIQVKPREGKGDTEQREGYDLSPDDSRYNRCTQKLDHSLRDSDLLLRIVTKASASASNTFFPRRWIVSEQWFIRRWQRDSSLGFTTMDRSFPVSSKRSWRAHEARRDRASSTFLTTPRRQHPRGRHCRIH